MEKGNQPTIKSGDKLKEVETNKRVNTILIDFLRGYPIWKYWGIFEYYFGEKIGNEIIKKLEEHEILEVVYAKNSSEKTFYSLAPKGVEVAISMTNLGYSKRMDTFTFIMTLFGALTLLVGLNQLLFQIIEIYFLH
jgi:hypothetical protein